MRNKITTEPFDMSDASLEVRQAAERASGKRPRELIRNDHGSDVGKWHDLPSKIVSSTCAFEGFGSFSG